jgi:hypothetical protein
VDSGRQHTLTRCWWLRQFRKLGPRALRAFELCRLQRCCVGGAPLEGSLELLDLFDDVLDERNAGCEVM